MNASMWLSGLLGRPARAPGRRLPRRPPCRPRVENLEGRLTPSYGGVLRTIHGSSVVNDRLGASVAVSDDQVVVGAPGGGLPGFPNSGEADGYNAVPQPGENPHLYAVLGNPGDNFGWSVSEWGDWVAVGAKDANGGSGEVTVYHKNDLPLHFVGQPNEHLGTSVSIGDNLLVVGAPGANGGTGAAYWYDLSVSKPSQSALDHSTVANGGFGTSVAVAGNYNAGASSYEIMVGAPYDNVPGGPTGEGTVNAYNLTFHVNGNLRFGLVSPPLILTSPAPTASEWFGYSVALSISGNTTRALIGAPGYSPPGPIVALIGRAYLYDLGSHQWVTLDDPIPHPMDFFGQSVSLWGNNALVGALGRNGGAGAAYLYDAATGTGSPILTLSDPNTACNDGFGRSVAVSDQYAVVGAEFDSSTGVANAGAAYVFDLTPNPPPPGPSPGPQPGPPARHAITARMYRVKKHHRRVWEVAVSDVVTGKRLAEFRCPYQEPAYRHVHLMTVDANHDGLADTVILTARRGRRAVSRSYPMA